MKACSQTSMTSSGLKPAGTPSWWSVIQWLVSRSVAGSWKRMTQPAGQLGELRILAGGLALAQELGQFLVEDVHLLDVARVELQVLGDLVVRDALQPVKLIEGLLFVSLDFGTGHNLTSGAQACNSPACYHV